MKKYTTILAAMLAMACANTEVEPHEQILVEELPEMSIYHLPAQWTTQHGEEIELADLKGNILVVVMIYTQCKAACPRLMADMQNIEKQVSPKAKKNVKYLLISIDPSADTPEQLSAFAREYGMTQDHWLFLRGTESTVREFANILAVKYKQISPIDFSHSNIISVFDEKGVMQHQMEGLGVDNHATVEKILELSK